MVAEGSDTDYADGRVAVETVDRLRNAKNRRENEGTHSLLSQAFVFTL